MWGHCLVRSPFFMYSLRLKGSVFGRACGARAIRSLLAAPCAKEAVDGYSRRHIPEERHQSSLRTGLNRWPESD
jgi:hypothetical protein